MPTNISHMLLQQPNPDLTALVISPLKMHQLANIRLVCKSLRMAVGDFKKKVEQAAEKFTQIQRLSPSNFLLHTRLGKHTVEFSPINYLPGREAREYSIHVNQQRFIGTVASANVNDRINARIAVLHARNGFFHSKDNKTWISEITSASNGRITSVQTSYVYYERRIVVNFEKRDTE